MNKRLTVDELADLIGNALREQGETYESMWVVLREERACVFAERYPEAFDQDDEDEESE